VKVLILLSSSKQYSLKFTVIELRDIGAPARRAYETKAAIAAFVDVAVFDETWFV
jgi:hypothetical protein